MNIIPTVVLEKRTPKKKDKEEDPDIYPIKLRITWGKQQRYFSLPMSKTNNISFQATEPEWERIHSQGTRGRLRDISLQIAKIIEEAESIIRELDPFSFVEFRKLFYKQGPAEKGLLDYFQEYIDQLHKEGRVATAQSYQSAMNSFKSFDPGINFIKVDKAYLSRYEAWFLAKKKGKEKQAPTSPTTVGIFARSLRTIFNIARKDGVTDNYPFGAREYTPPSGANVKKALELEHVKKIIDFQTEHKSPLDKARDLWVFSYFSNGMNFKDMCSIRVKDIKGNMDTIEFVREKTRLSRKGNQKKIEVEIVPETKAVIEKWGTISEDQDAFVFPFFKKEFTPLQKRKTVMQLVKTTNSYLEALSTKLNLPMVITTYHARHSYASILKESGAPIEYISEALGHASPRTTESYLKSFSKAHRKKWAEVLRGNKPAE